MKVDVVNSVGFRKDGAGMGGVHVGIVLNSIMILNSFTFFDIFVSAMVLLRHVSSMDRSAAIRHAAHIGLRILTYCGRLIRLHLCVFLLQVVVHLARKFLLDLRMQQIPFKG